MNKIKRFSFIFICILFFSCKSSQIEKKEIVETKNKKTAESKSSAERIIEIEKVEDEPKSENLDRQSVYKNLSGIRFDSVRYGYDRDVVINDASAFVKKGDFRKKK